MFRHKQEADEIVRVAKAANDTSTEAYQLLLKTLAGGNQTAKDIDELNRKWVSNGEQSAVHWVVVVQRFLN